MDVTLSDEQQMLAATADGLAASLAPESPAALPVQTLRGDAWASLVRTGLVGLRLPADVGGAEATGVEIALVAEAFGRHTSTVPFLGSAVFATGLLTGARADASLLGSIADGSRRFAVGLDPSLTRLATHDEDAVAWDALGSEGVLVRRRDTGGLVAVSPTPTPLHGADLTRSLLKVAADSPMLDIGPLGTLDADTLARCEALWLTALSADLLGVMGAALDDAVEHVSERRQFGVPVGSFQAVAHMAADAHVSVESSRSATWHAAWAVDALPAADALLVARAAKAFASAAGRDVTETAIQMFGGVGMTWECRAHVLLRRALLDRRTLGDEQHQYQEIANTRLGAEMEPPTRGIPTGGEHGLS